MWRYIVWLLLLLPQWSAAEGVRLSYAVESFRWEEFDGGESLLDETGFRHVLALEGERRLTSHWLAELAAHVNYGTVDYAGQDSEGNAAETETNYRGFGLEAALSMFPEEIQFDRQLVAGARLALGTDYWSRDLLGPGGYTERYQSIYTRAAAIIALPQAWRFELGAKWPALTTEKVDLGDYGIAQEIELQPKGQPSMYGKLTYHFDERFAVRFAYDAYAFDKSNSDSVYTVDGSRFIIHQPKSDLYTLSLGLVVTL